MKYLPGLAVVFLLLVPSVCESQQISPNPNPRGNTITVANAGEFNNDFFDNYGEINVTSTGMLNNNGTLYNDGTLTSDGTLENRGDLTNDHNMRNNGTLNNNNGGTLNNYAYLNNYGTLNNNGTLDTSGTLGNAYRLYNNGTVDINHRLDNGIYGTLTNDGTLNNYSYLNNLNQLINDGTLTNDGRLTNFLNRNTNNDSLTNNGTLTNDGTLENQGNLYNYGTLTNDGTLDNSGTFLNDGTFDNTNGTFDNSGTFSGAGNFVGAFTDSGVLAPGYSAGVLTFTGELSKTGGSMEIELGGLFDGGSDKSLTEFDWIDVTGDVVLGGSLNVMLIDAFSLSSDMSFDFLRVGGTLSGQYDGLGEGDLVGNFGGRDLFITYGGGDGNDVSLFTAFGSAVPEPTTVLIWSMLAGLGMTVRRRR